MTPDAFISRWSGQEGGAERANYAMFLTELCDLLNVPRPDPAQATTAENDYVFERAVKLIAPDGSTSTGRIDLYKRGCFVLEAKQSRLATGAKALQTDLFSAEDLAAATPRPGRQAAAANTMLMNARLQAETYAKSLPPHHGWPPFIIVADVGRALEIRADFSLQGKNYAQFPDRQSFRITLEDLRDDKIRQRLRAIWTDPLSQDPARRTARVTRAIAEKLAAISKALEARQHKPERVAMFLMRCLFTMFAEDTGLLPDKSFKSVLEQCEARPDNLIPMVGQLWDAMDKGEFAFAIGAKVKKFNGAFFKEREVIPLQTEELTLLRLAAGYDWKEVDPSIFGTLLEQALDPQARKSLGAHYTPRAYVERLVIATMIEPLRQDWTSALTTAERQQAEGRGRDAIATLTAFRDSLCKLRVLDPACGTGNFLYVALELLKRLEGEVLEALANFGGQEQLSEFAAVDPHQFLGLEINPRAAGIAELVLWIGYLQWHFRTKGGFPAEPILRAFKNISVTDAVLDNSGTVPKRPKWPAAEFIVGNPPFIGGKDLRARLGDSYTEALWAANTHMNDSADFVMYWWDHAADLLVTKSTVLRRFGFVTTNSISQVFQRKVLDRHFTAKSPISLLYAIPDHPWTKATKDSAAVRIAMTVATAGKAEGVLEDVVTETGLDTDTPNITYKDQRALINSDLTVGADVTVAKPLQANEGLSSPGVKLHGAGFIVTPEKAKQLGLGKRPGLENHIWDYRNGRDLMARSRGVYVIDLYPLSPDEARRKFPEVYQHILMTVKPERDKNNMEFRRLNWCWFGATHEMYRSFKKTLPRYIVTAETTKHRVFQFLDAKILADNMLVAIGSADAYHLGVLSSQIHVHWALRAGGWLGMGNDPRYSKSRCFDPFPFPDATEPQKQAIRAIAEELDAHRKTVLADPEKKLTLTGLYNTREAILKSGTKTLSPEDRRVMETGLVLILNELHEKLDKAVAAAYGWQPNLPEAEILSRLVALNKTRIKEEARGVIKWLRPDYQIPRFGSKTEKLDLAGAMHTPQTAAPATRRNFPTEDSAQTAEIMAVLAHAPTPLTPDDIRLHFKPARNLRPKIDSILAGLTRLGLITTHASQITLRRP